MSMELEEDQNNGQMREYMCWEAADDPKADLKIVSSDEWVFWVQSAQLGQLSPVFKQMLETCATPDMQPTLRLTDPEFESAVSLSSILPIVKEQAEEDPEHWITIRDYLDVNMVNFAQKYEMISVLNNIKLYLFKLAAQFPPKGGQHVLEAATLGEWDLCGRLVMSLDSRHEDGHMEEDTYIRQVLDWRGWTPEIIRDLSKISDKFLWAVCQVGTKHAKLSGYGRLSYTDMGPDLARVMNTPEYDAEGIRRWVQGDKLWWERPYRE